MTDLIHHAPAPEEPAGQDTRKEVTNYELVSAAEARSDLASRLREHTLPYLMSLLNCTEEQAMDARLTWQILDDHEGQKNPCLVRTLHGPLKNLFELFEDLNREGAAICLSVNKTDRKGRTKAHIKELRSVWADLDQKKADEALNVESLPLRPTVVVNSGHGNHIFWGLLKRVEADPKNVNLHESTLRGIQQTLAPLGADEAVCEVARVMRIPGFYNMKRKPYPLVRLIEVGGPRYSLEEIGTVFPPVEKKDRSTKTSTNTVAPAPAQSPQSNVTDTGVDRSEVLRLAGQYLEGCPPAIGGDGGHSTTFTNALKVISGFDLTPDEAMEVLVDHYNPRCEPPWSESELAHKIEDSHRIAQESQNRGWLLRRYIRPQIVVGAEHLVVEESIKALAPHGDIYSRQGSLYRVITRNSSVSGGGGGQRASYPTLEPANPYWIRDLLSQRADYHRTTSGEPRHCSVPEWLPPMLMARRQWDGIDELKAVVETPVFLEGGRILAEPGFDEESGIFVSLNRGAYPPVPKRPTREDAEAALMELWEVVADFHFAADPSPECHCAAWLAFVLTILGRFAIDGPVPYALVDASVAGSGKGLLVKAATTIALGRVVPTMSCVTDEEEMRKRILLPLMTADRVAWIDDAPCPFGGNTWNALMTSWPEYRDRILGKSETVSVPATTVWAVTGNNLTLRGDSSRRALHIRLEPRVEHPEERDDFKIIDLCGYVDENHPRLLVAALTILRAYHLAGSPSSGLPPLGSFEAWSRAIRDCVYWVTGEDVCLTQRRLGAIADETSNAAGVLLGGIYAVYEARTFTCQDLLDRLNTTEPSEVVLRARNAADQLKRSPAELSARSLGHILSGLRGRIIGEYQLHVAASRSQGNLYRVTRLSGCEVPVVREVVSPSGRSFSDDHLAHWDQWAEPADRYALSRVPSGEQREEPQQPPEPRQTAPGAPPNGQVACATPPAGPNAGTVARAIPATTPLESDENSWLRDDKLEDARLKEMIRASVYRG